MKKSIEQQLAEGLEKAQEVGNCLEWQGSMDHGKTPVIKTRMEKGGREVVVNITVPKYIWERKNGPLPTGMIAYRTCCNNACVEECHIKAGTRSDLMAARKKAGLTRHSRATVISQTVAARSRANTVYSIEVARQVRELRAEGLLHKQIAARTNVNENMVREICSGRAWKDTSNPFAALLN